MAVARTHRPVWSCKPCLDCRTCMHACPVTVFPELGSEEGSLRGRVAREMVFPAGPLKIPPCRAACPLGQDVPSYVQALGAGDFDRAYSVILQSNPLPSICGRLCLRACMSACVRGVLDRPVEIRALKRAAAELAGKRTGAAHAERKGRVAVVGSGPAGLATAFFLGRLGRAVTVYESQEEPGGLLRRAVPEFDLPRAALDEDIRTIVESGVVIETRSAVRSRADLDRLFSGGAGAVVLAVGAGKTARLGIPGQELRGSMDVLAFVSRRAPIQGGAVIAGSGDMAVAAARMAVRAGANPVSLLMRRSLREASCDPDKLRLAEEEGVVVYTEIRPERLLGSQQVEAVRCAPIAFGPEDGAGRRWAQDVRMGGTCADQRQGRDLQASVFVAGESREVELGWLETDALGPWGTLRVDAQSLMGDRHGLFAAGEALTGPRNVVAAISSAMQVATAVDRFLQGEGQ